MELLVIFFVYNFIDNFPVYQRLMDTSEMNNTDDDCVETECLI